MDDDPSPTGGDPPASSTWDVFRSDRLEVERAMPLDALRAALDRGDLHAEDLVRPSGSDAPWSRLADLAALAEPPAPAPIPPAAESHPPPGPVLPPDPGAEAREPGREGPDDASISLLALPIDADDADDDADGYDPQEEDDEAAEFTLARGSLARVEELDLAAMVDVAFQMVLFFMVTATTILYKTLEVPRTAPETPPGAVAQGQPRKTVDDLENDYILVEIDPEGAIRVDHEPANPAELAARLRAAREATGRTAMLLSADLTTPHRNAVLAYDAANEIGLSIAIARPSAE